MSTQTIAERMLEHSLAHADSSYGVRPLHTDEVQVAVLLDGQVYRIRKYNIRKYQRTRLSWYIKQAVSEVLMEWEGHEATTL